MSTSRCLALPVLAWVLVAAGPLACAKRSPQPAAPESSQPTPTPTPPQLQLGATPEAPVMRCGAQDSYQWVAREFRCADGNNPLGGDPKVAAKARAGSQPSPDPNSQHMLDIYVVPCAEGPQRVYVDMYACPHKVPPTLVPSQAFTAAFTHFEAGDFPRFIAACTQLLGANADSDGFHCIRMLPVAHVLAGQPDDAREFLGRVCTSLPPPSELSRIRAAMLAEISDAFQDADQRHPGRIADAEYLDIMIAAGAACGLQDAAVDPTSGRLPEIRWD